MKEEQKWIVLENGPFYSLEEAKRLVELGYDGAQGMIIGWYHHGVNDIGPHLGLEGAYISHVDPREFPNFVIIKDLGQKETAAGDDLGEMQDIVNERYSCYTDVASVAHALAVLDKLPEYPLQAHREWAMMQIMEG